MGTAARAVGSEERRFAQAARYMLDHQNEDGGWGELPRSYDDPASKGIGPSTPSQTAWGLLALLATGGISHTVGAPGMERNDLIKENGPIFTARGIVISERTASTRST